MNRELPTRAECPNHSGHYYHQVRSNGRARHVVGDATGSLMGPNRLDGAAVADVLVPYTSCINRRTDTLSMETATQSDDTLGWCASVPVVLNGNGTRTNLDERKTNGLALGMAETTMRESFVWRVAGAVWWGSK